MSTHLHYCDYFQARLDRSRTLYSTAFLRSFEHLAFDRTIDAALGMSEFFVPHDQREHFVHIMAFLQEQGYVYEFWQLPNRLAELGTSNS